MSQPLGRKKLISDTGPCFEWLNVLQPSRIQLSCSEIPCMLKAKAVCKCLKNAPLLTVRAPGVCYCLGQPGNSQRDATFLFAEVFHRIWIPQHGRQFQRKKIKGTDLLMKCQNFFALPLQSLSPEPLSASKAFDNTQLCFRNSEPWKCIPFPNTALKNTLQLFFLQS